jgi:hypothetical protein
MLPSQKTIMAANYLKIKKKIVAFLDQALRFLVWQHCSSSIRATTHQKIKTLIISLF